VGALLYGLLVLAADLALSRLLLLGDTAGSLGITAAYLGGLPEELVTGPLPFRSRSCLLADTSRLATAACLRLALARRVTSPGVALLIAGVATAVDLVKRRLPGF
jgi:hypothetical protein